VREVGARSNGLLRHLPTIMSTLARRLYRISHAKSALEATPRAIAIVDPIIELIQLLASYILRCATAGMFELTDNWKAID
jgi:hypothetical protein